MSLRSLIVGWMGEVQTSLGQRLLLDQNTYISINNLTLDSADGSTQIDHVIVSRFGIFVVETKKLNGWIFANEKHAQWTQCLFGKKFQFQNPLRQNYRHIKVLSQLLNLPEEKFHSVVVFWGSAKFQTAIPPQVITSGYTAYIKQKSEPILNDSAVTAIVNTLNDVALPKTWKTRRDHIKSLKERFENTARCPKGPCQNNSIESNRNSRVKSLKFINSIVKLFLHGP